MAWPISRTAKRSAAVREMPRFIATASADYEAMARQPDFQIALDRLTAEGAQRRVCLMCAGM